MKKKIIFLLILPMLFVINVSAKEMKLGTYKISYGNDETKLLVENNGNIELGNDQSGGEKLWDVFTDGNNWYIRANSSNNSLDIANSKIRNNTNIQISKTNNSNSQKWKLVFADKEYYYIKSAIGNYNIDVSAASKQIGANIQLFHANGTNAQKWKFIRTDIQEKVIEDGTYIVKSKIKPSNVIDLSGANTKNTSNIQIYSNNLTWAQAWNIKYEGGYYKISSYIDNNKVFDVNTAKFANYTNIHLYQANGTNAQKFIIVKNDDNTYSITSYDNLWSIDIAGASNKAGANLQLYQQNGTDAQKFSFEKTNISLLENGYYNINSALDSNKVIGVSNKALANGKNVDLRTATNSNYTKWYIKRIENDIYTIANADNQKMVLDVSGNLTANETNVHLHTSNNTSAQKWVIRRNDDNTYKIIGLNSKKVLDVKSAGTLDGTNIQIFESNGTDAQKWSINPTEVSKYVREYDDDKYVIKQKNTNYVFDVTSASKVNGTNIQRYQSNDTPAQVWRLEYTGDGEYLLRSMLNPKLVLTATSDNVVLSKYVNNDSQKWFFDKVNNDTKIISKVNGKYASVVNNNIALSTESNNSLFELSKFSKTLKYKGIDVSKHNGTINWSKAANQIDFAVIRAGYSDEIIQNGVDKYQDVKYLDNIKGCEDNNIPYALYFYSYANKLNDTDNPSYNKGKGGSADSEASHMLSLIKKAKDKGYTPNLSTSIYFDQEENDVYNTIYNNTKNINSTKTLLTNIVNRFCSKMKSNGYNCGMYASKSWIDNKVNRSSLEQNGVKFWVAQWPMLNATTQKYQSFSAANNDNSTFTNPKIWQFSSTGTISGISTRVDLSFGYNIFE